MFRYLSAIGMSRYIDQKALDEWIMDFLHSHPKDVIRYPVPGSHGIHLEFVQNMGPFKLVIKTYTDTPGELHVYSVLPAATSGTMSRVLDWQIGLEDRNLFIWGEDESAGGILEVMLAQSGRVLAMRRPHSGHAITVAYTALSIEGKILLGVKKSKEELAYYEEEEEWRRQMLQRMRSGDPEALQELEYEAQEQEKEILERMNHEDVFTILEGLFIPADELTTALYQAMGTILDVDKVFNAATEEWVYHLQLDVMGSPLDVYIHPDDLVGMPSKGMRFMGKVRLIGMAHWDSR